MRRISVIRAQMGMTLGRAICDSKGYVMFREGMVLDSGHLNALPSLGIAEIVIQDSRVADVIIVPMISEDVESKIVRFVNRIMEDGQGLPAERIKIDAAAMDRLVKQMVNSFFTVFIGEVDVQGCNSLGSFDNVHPVKTAALSLLIGKQLGLDRADLTSLGVACLLQNIGYLLLPQRLLSSAGPGARADLPGFKQHPALGRQIAKLNLLEPRVAEAIYHHHECWNGSGYPAGLKGNSIPLFARIMAIAGKYHELVSASSDKTTCTPPEAAEYIAAYSGEEFDPDIVQVFYRSVPFYSKGKAVRLSSGEVGFITATNIGYVGRPVVRICYGKNGEEVEKPYDVDLSKSEHQDKMITEMLDL